MEKWLHSCGWLTSVFSGHLVSWQGVSRRGGTSSVVFLSCCPRTQVSNLPQPHSFSSSVILFHHSALEPLYLQVFCLEYPSHRYLSGWLSSSIWLIVKCLLSKVFLGHNHLKLQVLLDSTFFPSLLYVSP